MHGDLHRTCDIPGIRAHLVTPPEGLQLRSQRDLTDRSTKLLDLLPLDLCLLVDVLHLFRLLKRAHTCRRVPVEENIVSAGVQVLFVHSHFPLRPAGIVDDLLPVVQRGGLVLLQPHCFVLRAA